ncbi:MAG: hypothetical protein HC769_01210 [Cyanobacteria bacterium CRU_2_1]|nr:hypothetical protein [Cyanobacteria bacterium CRU_2_1]
MPANNVIHCETSISVSGIPQGERIFKQSSSIAQGVAALSPTGNVND